MKGSRPAASQGPEITFLPNLSLADQNLETQLYDLRASDSDLVPRTAGDSLQSPSYFETARAALQLYLRLPWHATCVDRMARARDFDLVTVGSRGILAFELRGWWFCLLPPPTSSLVCFSMRLW